MTASTAAGMATTGSGMVAAAASGLGRTLAVQDSPGVQNFLADLGLWVRILRSAEARG